MKLYHISPVPLHSSNRIGETIELLPRVPENTASLEDDHTPRICTCMSILGCIQAIEATWEYETFHNSGFYVYETEVSESQCMFPDYDMVPDVQFTNEIWIITPAKFTYVGHYHIDKTVIFPNTNLARFQVYADWEDPPVDRIIGELYYGEPESFQFIGACKPTVELVDYVSKHRKDYMIYY